MWEYGATANVWVNGGPHLKSKMLPTPNPHPDQQRNIRHKPKSELFLTQHNNVT
jgi:hypothetical protein